MTIRSAVRCPQCDSADSQVRDSRPSDIGVKRRRYCPHCETRWTTYELSVTEIENIRTLREEIESSIQRMRALADRLPQMPAIPHQADRFDRLETSGDC